MYFTPRWTFRLPGLCEPFEVASWSFLLNDTSLGSVCCGGAFAEAPLEASLGVSVGHIGSYKVFEDPS